MKISHTCKRNPAIYCNLNQQCNKYVIPKYKGGKDEYHTA